MKKNTKNLPIIIGIILVLIGSLLPSIKIAQENINFIKENGPLIIILVSVMIILLKFEKKELITVPSILSLALVIKFTLDNKLRLKEINEKYNCFAGFKYGLVVMIIGNILILVSLILSIPNLKEKKELLKNKLKEIIEKIKEKIKNIKPKQHKLTAQLIEKISKKESKQKITKETTKDGKIKFNKIIVKVDKRPREKKTLKEKLDDLLLKLRIKRITSKKLSIARYKDEKPAKKKNYIPTLNIRKWTRDEICCVNCGATVKSTSEYCFLCDCKIKLTDKEEKLS